MSRQCALILLLLCVRHSHANILEKSKSRRGIDFPWNGERQLKATKGSKGDGVYYDSPVAWSPALSPAANYATLYGLEPTAAPAEEPTMEPTFEPTTNKLFASGNIFDLPEQKDNIESPGKSDTVASSQTLKTARHVVAHVSVAIPRTVRPLDVQEMVAKVTTKIIRSYTPFVVYVLDGTRRHLQTTDLLYDRKFSAIMLVHHGHEVSWWKYSVAYEVTKQPEEMEEAGEIDDLAESAVEGAILSGLFQQLLEPMAPDIRGVAVPGHELDYDVEAPKATGSKQPTDEYKRNRAVGIGLGLLCVCVLLVSSLSFAIADRRRRRAVEAAWAISLGGQRDVGQILRAEWNYGETSETDFKGAFTLGPRDPDGAYLRSTWEYGASTETDLVNSSLSVDNGSLA